MGEIRIGTGTIGLGLLAVLAAAGVLTAKQLPELRRYIKISQM